jgi:phosphotransferase system enzyme I (PtsI)
LKIIQGIRISPGIVIGPVYYFEPSKIPIPQHHITTAEVEAELKKFRVAAEKATADLNQVRTLVLKHLDEDHARLIDAQLIALTDVDLVQEVTELVRGEHRNILWAYYSAMERFEKALVNSFNQFQQERMIDLHDVKRESSIILSSQGEYTVPRWSVPSVYVSERITPSELINIHNQNTIGLITGSAVWIRTPDSGAGLLIFPICPTSPKSKRSRWRQRSYRPVHEKIVWRLHGGAYGLR